jgi:hypothetical protein
VWCLCGRCLMQHCAVDARAVLGAHRCAGCLCGSGREEGVLRGAE